MMMMKNPEDCKAAAVLGNTVKIYGSSKNGFRPYMSSIDFSNHGKAKEYAEEFDTKQRTEAKQ